MKKCLSFLFVALAFATYTNAQQAYEGVLKVKKNEQPAVVIDYNYPKDVVESALKAALSDKRLKPSSKKGVIKCSGAVISEVSPMPLDYSFNLKTNGKKGKETTSVYMIMEGSNALAGDAASYARGGKSFLESLAPGVEKSNRVSELKKQEEILAKEEKKLKDLKSDQSSLEKKLSDNKREQDKQSNVVSSQRSVVEGIRQTL
ncbi:MAG: hypothetical protein QM727_13990 [Niabella sp.]